MANNPGAITCALPPGHGYQKHTAYRTWTQSLVTTTLLSADNLSIRHLWGIPRGHQYTKDRGAYREWAWNYNKNLIGKDKLPTGNQITELPPKAHRFIPLQFTPDLRTWTVFYNLNLIGKDKLPAGSKLTERPAPIVPKRPSNLDTWTWCYSLTLIGKDNLPVGDSVYELAPRGYPPQHQQRTWTWQYNVNLIAQDEFPPGQIVDELVPRPYPPQHGQRTWTWWYSLTLIGKDVLPTGRPLYDLTPKGPLQPDRFWAWSYNLNLVAQDELPSGNVYSDRPAPVLWYRDWSLNLLASTLASGAPFSQYDWPLPRAPRPVTPSWAWSYNLNLIGQDELPAGEISVERTPRGPLQPDRFWSWSYNLNLVGKDVLPTGRNIYDRTPSGPLQPDRFWSWSYNLNLVAQDSLPTGTRITELAPRDYQRSPPSWAWWYNLNLVAQDALPAGTRYTERPPPVFWYRDWSQNLQLTTLSIIVNYPFNQFDWPLPRDYRRGPPSWTASYLLTLIGRDVLPSGAQRYDRVPPPKPPPGLTWTWQYNLNLIGKDRLPSGSITTELPRSRPPVVPSWTWDYNHNLIGKDRLPTGAQQYDLAPRGHYRPLQAMIFSTFLPRFAFGTKPFSQIDWPLSQKHYPQMLQAWTSFMPLGQIAPVTFTTVDWIIRARRRHRRS